METNYQKFLAGEYCNHLDQEVLQMIVQTKNLLARLNATNITDSATRDALLRGCPKSVTAPFCYCLFQ